MVALPDGQVLYFRVREAARLQTFPDDYYFRCTWGESMRQIGNAVPVNLAYILASSISTHLRKVCYSYTESSDRELYNKPTIRSKL